jgi:hypothetical protein
MVRWIGLAAAALAASGCGVESKGGPRVARPAPAPCPRGAFDPVAVVIHPLTRLEPDGAGGTRIDAHIEFRDAAGDEVKGAGRLSLELSRETGPVTGLGSSAQLLRWEADLSDAGMNSRSYDRVTRTYRFELTGLPEWAAGGGLVLRAILTPAGGAPMRDERALSP